MEKLNHCAEDILKNDIPTSVKKNYPKSVGASNTIQCAIARILIICLINLLELSLRRCHPSPSDNALDESISAKAASYRCLPSGTANSDGPLRGTRNAWSTCVGNKKTKPSVPPCTLPQLIIHDGPTVKA
ncbi:UNVERIFIED_CONTAM: hypothetical protein Sradi_5425700 [Sesamum radiatum]|uniref:Uncharacterized protein n=1 Tax=Sesamum radiatum TaxID=300843 RepID=A0AAW2LAW2_SESRA